MLTSMGGLWHRISSAFERTDIAASDPAYDLNGGSSSDEEMVRRTVTRYAPIREAVERRVNSFLRQDLVSHLEIGFREIFLLHYIEIAADGEGAATLTQFLHEFSPESRVHWIKQLLGPAVGQHVSVDQFLGLDQEFSVADLAETDPFEEKLNQAATPRFRVILHGRWASGPAAADREKRLAPPLPPGAPGEEGPASVLAPPGAAQSSGVLPFPPAQPSPVAGPCVRLSVQDAKSTAPGGGARVVEIEHFPAVLGSSVHADIEVSGYYVSARHCTLHWEGQQLWLADHSTNGTWVDGERVHRGTRIALVNGAVLGFGRDKGDKDHDRYPAIHARLMRNPVTPGAGSTPVAPSSRTPVAPGVATLISIQAAGEKAPLAVLVIVDASGSPRRDILKLPFTIGRGSAQDYVVPDANQGVSREHLVIEDINRAGAVTLNRAVSKNGTFAGNQALPERFVWRFGQEIVLGEKWTSAPAVRLSLRQVERPF
jgi:pSer/pThr/pTyr-binding forkhead associated (FHA) protein